MTIEINTRDIVAEQFADDYLLIAMNDYETYSELSSKRELNTASLSKVLEEEWEELLQQVSDLVTRDISPIASDFILQMLSNNGSLPFDKIAKRLKED
jgi:hypothetical protein